MKCLDRPAPNTGATASVTRPLIDALPALQGRVVFAGLGDFPTSCQPLALLDSAAAAAGLLYVKRDDQCSAVYGGNKVRTLEVLLGDAVHRGLTQAVSSGAFGSNHATATCLHAPRLGLQSGALLCPQPASEVAQANFAVTAAHADRLELLPHWSALPWALWRWRARQPLALVMPPGGASPLGALGYVSAALELAQQVRQGLLPCPRRIVLPIGSTCTSAGLLVGLRLASALGLGFESGVPLVHAVRVTPWPVTSVWRTAWLAQRTSQLLVHLSRGSVPEFDVRQLRAGLHIDGRYLGAGYGRPAAQAQAMSVRLGDFGSSLDSTYSAKAAAALDQFSQTHTGPTLFWATKSSAPLPVASATALQSLPQSSQSWLVSAEGY